MSDMFDHDELTDLHDPQERRTTRMSEPIKSMDIKIIDTTEAVVPKKTGDGSYNQLSVTFDNLTFGKVDGKKLTDWASKPKVYDTLKNAEKGAIFRLSTQKNERGFIDWLDIEAIDAAEVVQAAAKPAAARTGGTGGRAAAKGAEVSGTWADKNALDRERFEFDKVKQALIIRQSSLATAVNFVKDSPETGVEAVIKIARRFEVYVNAGE